MATTWNTFATESTSNTPQISNITWTETAFDWMQRCQTQKQHLYENVTDPSSAAWAFFCGSKTQIGFIDEAIKSTRGSIEKAVILLEGESGVGKTWTLLTLAARFVVSTRSSKFNLSTQTEITTPHVIVFDPWYRFDMNRLMIAIRAALYREEGDPPEDLEFEVQNCLKRIHFVYADNMDTIVISLEALGDALKDNNFPSLLMWDDFLVDTTVENEDLRKLSSRLSKLQKESCIQIILSTSRPQLYRGSEVTHRIRMGRAKDSSKNEHGFVATIQGTKKIEVAYTVGQGGVLT